MSNANETLNSPTIGRRTIVKGAAWAVPVVAVSAAAPAFAASRCVPVPVIDGLQSCKVANEDKYRLVFGIGGNNCDDADCTGTIYRIWESTGQGRTLWESTAGLPADNVSAVNICGAHNMSNFVMVNASFTCGTTQTSGDYQVRMPNFMSSGNTCPSGTVITC